MVESYIVMRIWDILSFVGIVVWMTISLVLEKGFDIQSLVMALPLAIFIASYQYRFDYLLGKKFVVEGNTLCVRDFFTANRVQISKIEALEVVVLFSLTLLRNSKRRSYGVKVIAGNSSYKSEILMRSEYSQFYDQLSNLLKINPNIKLDSYLEEFYRTKGKAWEYDDSSYYRKVNILRVLILIFVFLVIVLHFFRLI